MMENQLLFEAISRLQNLRKFYSKNGKHQLADVTDKAITLVLSSRRKRNEYLSNNAFRNALSAFNKSVRLRRIINLPNSESECVFYPQKITFQIPSNLRSDFILEQMLLRQILERIASSVHLNGKIVIDGMLDQTPIADTAALLNCSERTIESIRSLIRREIKQKMERDELWN